MREKKDLIQNISSRLYLRDNKGDYMALFFDITVRNSHKFLSGVSEQSLGRIPQRTVSGYNEGSIYK